jgi:hypothetical protein
MAGRGPAPKPPGLRQRTNRKPSAAVISANPELKAPRLPKHPGADEGQDWHPQVKAWWKDYWASPMAAECVESDRHGLFVLALMTDDFWSTANPSTRVKLAAEIRLSGQRYGTSPLDRNRLDWQVEETAERKERGQRRREATEPKPAPAPDATDPRAVLRSVK